MDVHRRLALLEAVLNTLADAIFVTDEAGAVVFRNAAAAAAEGASSAPRVLAQLTPLTVTTGSGAAGPPLTLRVHRAPPQPDVWIPGALPAQIAPRLHPDDLAAAVAFSESLAVSAPDAGATRHHDCRLRAADGTFRWTRCTASRIRDGGSGAAAQWRASAVDIQDLHDAELALSADRALLTAVVDELPVAVGVLAVPSGRSIVCNRKCTAMFPGLADIESKAAFSDYPVVYDPAGNLTSYEDWPIMRAMRGEHVTGETVDEALASGGKRRLRVSAAPVHAADGSIIAATFSAEDMTYAIQMEEERALRQATTQLLSNASHELRTPLNGIVGFSELLSHSALTDEQHEQLQCISECSNVLLRCVNDLLSFNKLAADMVELEAVPMRVAAVINTCALILQLQASAKGVRLEARVGHLDDLVVVGDPERFKQVVCNLLSNALKFTPTGGSITVDGSIVDDAPASDGHVTLRVAVTDSGIGIAAAALSRIWTPFAQADTSTTRKYGGTGLGLSIVRQLATLMHGEAGVSSVLGTGSTFWFTARLPRASSASLTADTGAGAASAAPSTTTSLSGPHALHVARMPVVLPLRVSTDAEATRSRASTPSVDVEAHISPVYALTISPATAAAAPSATAAGLYDCAASVPPLALSRLRVVAASGDDAMRLAGATASGATASRFLAPPAIAAVAASGAAASAVSARAPLLVVAEDDATNTLVMKRMLHKIGHTNVMFVSNGKEAVEAVAAHDVDCVLMDCNMAIMSGLDACRAIRSMPDHKASTPVVAVTASSMEEDRRACEAAGMSCFLSKPMTLASLTSALQHCLPTRSSTPADA